MKKTVALTVCTLFVLTIALPAVADFDTPVIKEWTKIEKNEKGQDRTVKYMSIDGVMVHETDPAKQPQPPVVTPGKPAKWGRPAGVPSDAIVLFDGKNLDNWTSTKEGKDTKWIVKRGAMMPTPKCGMIRSKQEFGSCQLHVEFATPKHVEGDGQGRGNSGVFLHGIYEVQVLDSYDNITYPTARPALSMAAANPSRMPAVSPANGRPTTLSTTAPSSRMAKS